MPIPMTPPAPIDVDPQCPLILQRIEELQADLVGEREASRRRQGRRQLRVLTERARCLGCLDGTRPRAGIDPLPP